MLNNETILCVLLTLYTMDKSVLGYFEFSKKIKEHQLPTKLSLLLAILDMCSQDNVSDKGCHQSSFFQAMVAKQCFLRGSWSVFDIILYSCSYILCYLFLLCLFSTTCLYLRNNTQNLISTSLIGYLFLTVSSITGFFKHLYLKSRMH